MLRGHMTLRKFRKRGAVLLQHMTDRKVVTAAGNRAALFTNEVKTFHFKIKRIIQLELPYAERTAKMNNKNNTSLMRHHRDIYCPFLFSNFTLLHWLTDPFYINKLYKLTRYQLWLDNLAHIALTRVTYYNYCNLGGGLGANVFTTVFKQFNETVVQIIGFFKTDYSLRDISKLRFSFFNLNYDWWLRLNWLWY